LIKNEKLFSVLLGVSVATYMKAYLLKKTGSSRVLQITDLPDPVPQKDEVLVRILYAGINYAEIVSRKGLYSWAPERPYVLGMEAVGIIEQLGEEVTAWETGQKVIVTTQTGCYAEKIAVSQRFVTPVLKYLTLEENAAFVVNYLTAWVSLFSLAKLQAGENLLVTSAAGGVGTAAVQLAVKYGCPVYGLAGSREKVAFIQSLGVAGALNYREADCFQKLRQEYGGMDVVLELVGGTIFKESFRALNPFGRMVVAGFSGLNLNKWNPFSWIKTYRDLPRVNILRLLKKTASIMATHIGYLTKYPEKLNSMMTDLIQFATKNKIKPVIAKVFPFEQAAEAHEYIESRKNIGKVLLKVSE
jgi:NADPH:quinone reductase-like Zn-dependent oxidoreductase